MCMSCALLFTCTIKQKGTTNGGRTRSHHWQFEIKVKVRMQFRSFYVTFSHTDHWKVISGSRSNALLLILYTLLKNLYAFFTCTTAKILI